MPPNAFQAMMTAQIANLSLSAIPAINQIDMLQINSNGAAGFTEAQVAVFSTGSNGACGGSSLIITFSLFIYQSINLSIYLYLAFYQSLYLALVMHKLLC